MLIMSTERHLTTGEAAKALSIDRTTLGAWHRQGLVTPAFITAGGHARWDLEDLKRQVRELRKRSN